MDPPAGFVRDKAIRDAWPVLGTPHSLVADKYSQKAAGPVTPGSVVEVKGERMTMRGQFKLGLFFYAEGAALVRNVDFPRLTDRDPQSISIGLIKLRPGVSPEKARADIAAALPSGTMVLTKSQLKKQEREYFLSTRPIGIMLYISMVIACLIGGAIILQVLSTEIANRMGEYAVLKAMGAAPALVYGIGLSQAAVVKLGAGSGRRLDRSGPATDALAPQYGPRRAHRAHDVRDHRRARGRGDIVVALERADPASLY